MKTKERILFKALELFNDHGLKDVTLRQIASSLEMSQGNLNYHFKTKAEIVSQLYFALVEKMDYEMNKISHDKPLLSFLYESAQVSMSILFQYRFITRDLYHLLGSDKTLKKHYLQLQQVRKQQYVLLFENLTHQGLMREEELEGEYERLYKRMNILGDNWVNAADFFNKEDASKVDYYHALLFEVIYPYLTKQGKKQYLDLFN
ncbi:TetR/AcrR family transcriptional regulator [Cyclobacterium sediminis]